MTPGELAALVQASVLRRFDHEEREARAKADLAEYLLALAKQHGAALELPKIKAGQAS